MRTRVPLFIAAVVATVFFVPGLQAAVIVFNADTTAENVAAHADWLSAIGESPDYFLDWETGFSDGDDISIGAPAALIPGGLSFGQGDITSGAGSIGGSNPIDTYAPIFSANESFSFASDINYLAFYDIDYPAGTIEVTLSDSSIVTLARDETAGSGDSAEFFGFYSTGTLITSVFMKRSFADSAWSLDNLEYGYSGSLVPIPAAVWLFGSALGLLGWMRRKLA